jgi:hypothetical protein
MAIALVGTIQEGQSSAATLTFTDTLSTASGNNRCVVVVVSNYSSSAGATNTPISSITYDTVAMTEVVQINSSTGSSAHAGIFYILDANLPATAGNYSVVVTTAGSNRMLAAVYELTGVDQSAPVIQPGVNYTQQPNGSVTNPIDCIVAPDVANAFIIDVLSSGGALFTATATGTTGQTARVQTQYSTAYQIFSSTLAASTTGNYTMEWTLNTTPSRQAQVVASFKPYVPPTESLFWTGSEF